MGLCECQLCIVCVLYVSCALGRCRYESERFHMGWCAFVPVYGCVCSNVRLFMCVCMQLERERLLEPCGQFSLAGSLIER